MYKLLTLMLVATFILVVFSACARSGGSMPQYPYIPPNYDADNGMAEQDLPVGVPLHNEYIVMLDVNPVERTVQGISRINFTNRSDTPLETIVLRVFLNAFQEDVLPRPYPSNLVWRMHRPGSSRGHMDIQSILLNNDVAAYNIQGTVLTIYLPQPLQPDSTAQLMLQFDAYVPMLGHRIGGNSEGMWLSMFLPLLAPYTSNGWHTEDFYPLGDPFHIEAANFHVTITTPLGHNVIGSGHRTEEIVEDTETKITRFTAPMARDFSFAILSSEYSHASITTDSGVEISLLFLSPLVQARAEYILQHARTTVEHFENYVGVYPFGHISILEVDLLHDSIASSQIVFVDTSHLARGNLKHMTHSIGSMWFSNIVGINGTAEPWLSKGLTRIVAAGIFYDTAESMQEFITQEYAAIADRTDLVIASELGAYTRHDNFVDAQGRKPMLMLHRLKQHMGEYAFWQAISNYYQSQSFQIATAEDFVHAAEEVYGNSLRAFFNVWLTQGTTPPMVTYVKLWEQE